MVHTRHDLLKCLLVSVKFKATCNTFKMCKFMDVEDGNSVLDPVAISLYFSSLFIILMSLLLHSTGGS